MIHVGIDLHRDSCMIRALNDVTGALPVDAPFPSERQALRDCLEPLCQQGELQIGRAHV